MQTKVFEGSSVRDCLRPRRATGCGVIGGASEPETIALSDPPRSLSLEGFCCGPEFCWLFELSAWDCDSLLAAESRSETSLSERCFLGAFRIRLRLVDFVFAHAFGVCEGIATDWSGADRLAAAK